MAEPRLSAPRRGGVRRWMAVRRVGTLDRDQRREVAGTLDEYAWKVPPGGQADPRRRSNLEQSMATKQPEAVADLLDQRRPALDHASERLVAAHAEYLSDVDAAGSHPSPGHDRVVVANETDRKQQYESIRKTWSELLGLRDRIEGQLALKRFMAPWLVLAIDALVFVADFLLFWQTLVRLLDVPLEFSIDAAVGAIASLLISVIGPSVVIVCSLAIARIMAMKRADAVAESLNLEMPHPVPDDPDEAPDIETSRVGRVWRWLRSPVASLGDQAPKNWIGVLYLSAFLLALVSIVYAVTFQARLQIAVEDTPEEFPAQLNIIAVLVFILPLAAIVANVAGSNHLADIVEEVEAKLEAARKAWIAARDARQQHDDEVERERRALRKAVVAAGVSWEGAWDLLSDQVESAQEWLFEVYQRHAQSREQMLTTERGLNDRLPLYYDDSTASSAHAATSVPDWGGRLKDSGIQHLQGLREILRLHDPRAGVVSPPRPPGEGPPG